MRSIATPALLVRLVWGLLRRPAARGVVAFAGLGLALCPAQLPAQEGASPATSPAVAMPQDGKAYEVHRFEISYVRQRAGLPAIEQIAELTVELGMVSDGYVQAREGVPLVRFRLADAPRQPLKRYYQSALLAIDAAVVRYFNGLGLAGVYVAQDSKDIDEAGNDVRPAERKAMSITILVGAVTEMRTVASGERVKEDQRINNPLHARILRNSPIQPGAGQGRDLIHKDRLDAYVYWLNRMPSRRVDVALAAAQEPGGVALDYLVSEARPWTVYAQISNTGTEQTDEWRERFGFLHNQLLGRDDVFVVDFLTAGFDESNALLASYEAPMFDLDRLRWKVFGLWSEFTASDVGVAEGTFEGQEYHLGGELIGTVFQHREWFLDLVAGLRFKHIETDNQAVQQEGEADFWQPYAGLRLERVTPRVSTRAGIHLIWSASSNVETVDSAGVSSDSLDGLGRLEAEEDWTVIQGELIHSFFLEPVLNPRGYQSLAHEVLLQGRIQYAFDDRLVPQEEEVAGGMYTVRGYPEAVLAGDTVLLASAEYRFHIPRAMKVEPDPTKTKFFGQPFRWSPQQQFGRPDWDLVLKGFIDIGRVIQNEPLQAFESRNNTLVGMGVGVELSIKQNISVRLDYGIALEDIEEEAGLNRGVDRGDSRLHVMFTLMY